MARTRSGSNMERSTLGQGAVLVDAENTQEIGSKVGHYDERFGRVKNDFVGVRSILSSCIGARPVLSEGKVVQ